MPFNEGIFHLTVTNATDRRFASFTHFYRIWAANNLYL